MLLFYFWRQLNRKITIFVNFSRVYPTGLSAGDARQALRRTEVVKSETNEDEAAQEIKQKGDSLRRVPKDENPALREMDERADVKVFFLCALDVTAFGFETGHPFLIEYTVFFIRKKFIRK